MKNFKIKLIFSFCLVLSFNFLLAQSNLITGLAFDKNYSSLPGATVLVEGTQNKVQADFDGKYSINASEGDVLIFSWVRLGPLRVTVEKNDSVINVNLDKKAKNQNISKKKKVIKLASNISSRDKNSTRVSNTVRQSNRIVNNEIKYSFAKEDLKEFLAIQALLSENRMTELSEFLEKNNYNSANTGLGVSFVKMEILNSRDVNEVYPVLIIESGKNGNQYVDNYIKIIFMKVNEESDFAKGLSHNYSDAVKIQNLIQKEIKLGMWYTMLTSFNDMEGASVEYLDRYTVKVIPDNFPDKSTTYKASNFTRIPGLSSNNSLTIAFSGPGKNGFTEIIFDMPIKNDSSPNKTLSMLRIRSTKSGNPESQKPFNLNFFMSLKNFNDRIWLDN